MDFPEIPDIDRILIVSTSSFQFNSPVLFSLIVIDILVTILRIGKGKVSVTSLGRPIRPALISGFRSMKRLGVFILPPGWDTNPSKGYPQHYAGTH